MTEKAAVAVTYSGSAVTIIMGLSISEWVAIAGGLIGLAGFCVNIWYKRECLKIEQLKLGKLDSQQSIQSNKD